MGTRPNDSDIVVLVLGPGGHGKSTFINHILNKEPEAAKTGDGFAPCTKEAGSYRTEIPKRPSLTGVQGNSLILVDTPGFENDDGVEISVTAVRKWLESSSFAKGSHHIGGLVYVYQAYPWNSDLKDSPTILSTELRELCGEGAANIVVATPKWDLVRKSWENSKKYESSELEKKITDRDTELKKIFHGMNVQRHHASEPESAWESAWEILEPVLKRCVQWRNSVDGNPSASVTTTPAVKATTATSSLDNDGTHGGGKDCC